MRVKPESHLLAVYGGLVRPERWMKGCCCCAVVASLLCLWWAEREEGVGGRVVVKGEIVIRREVCLAGSCREWTGGRVGTRSLPRRKTPCVNDPGKKRLLQPNGFVVSLGMQSCNFMSCGARS